MFQSHSDTSREAYQTLSNKQRQLDDVYKMIKQSSNNGITGKEMAEALKLPISTISARVAELQELKLVIRSNMVKKVCGKKSTLCFTSETMLSKFLSEKESRKVTLKNTLKELLTKDDQGGVYLSPLDVKRLEALC
jgi:predicted transcriptional regulator